MIQKREKEMKTVNSNNKIKGFSLIKNESCNMLQKGLEKLCRIE